jgi:hypothetical protein
MEKIMSNHYFEVDVEGMKKVISDTFSNDTWLSELCQNSFRAGATKLDFNYDTESHILSFLDDGRGFSGDDWNSYFTIASSGWGERVKAEQRPFGIGCASLLFAASEIVITSNGKQALINTESFLDGNAVSVRDVNGDKEITKGASFCITLRADVKFNVKLVEKTLSGFSIPVYVNGVEIERPSAEERNPHTIDFSFGRIAVQSLRLENMEIRRSPRGVPGTGSRLFISGLRVEAGRYRHANNSIVYLDPAKVRSRVPDRAELVGNREEVLDAIELAIKQAYASELAQLKDELSPDEFVNTYWFNCKEYAKDLLLDMPVPGFLLSTVASTPHAQLDGDEENHFCHGDDVVDLDSFSGDSPLRVFDFKDELCPWDCALDSDGIWPFNALNYLYLSQLPFIDSSALPKGHWLHKHLISFDENATFNIVHNGRVEVLNTEGFWQAEGVICDEFSVSVLGARSADGEDVVLEPVISREDALAFNRTVYFPANMDDPTSLCRQCVQVIFSHSVWDDSSYLDEDYLDKVESELNSWLLVQAGGGLSELVAKFLESHRSELAIFGGDLPALEVSFKREKNSAGGNAIKINVGEIAA